MLVFLNLFIVLSSIFVLKTKTNDLEALQRKKKKKKNERRMAKQNYENSDLSN